MWYDTGLKEDNIPRNERITYLKQKLADQKQRLRTAKDGWHKTEAQQRIRTIVRELASLESNYIAH